MMANSSEARVFTTISGRLFGQEAPEGLFPLFGCLGHALKKDGRAFYWRRLASTINFPPPGFLGSPSPLHDERIVRWVKFFTHELLDGDGPLNCKPEAQQEGLLPGSALIRSITSSQRRGGMTRGKSFPCRMLPRPQPTMQCRSPTSTPHIGSTPRKFHRHGRCRDEHSPPC